MIINIKLYSRISILSILAPGLLTIGYNVYTDPFQIIHKDTVKPLVVLSGGGSERLQHAGIIQHYKMNGIVLGNSYSSNFTPSSIEKKMELSHVFNLSINGAGIYEQSLPGKLAISKHDIKRVLWGFPAIGLLRDPKEVNKKFPIKEYLYDDNRLNDLELFSTLSFFKYNRLKNRERQIIAESDHPDELAKISAGRANSWYWKNECSYNKPLFIVNKLFKNKGVKYNKRTLGKLSPHVGRKLNWKDNEYKENYEGNVNKNIIPLVVSNPDIQFDFIFTPFPTIKDQKSKTTNNFRHRHSLLAVARFVRDMHKFNNVRVFGFSNEPWLDELRLFKDSSHYHVAANDYLIDNISKGKFVLTPDNVDQYISSYDERVSNYRLPKRWNPAHAKISMKRYISSRITYVSGIAARRMIDEPMGISDSEVARISMAEEPLPECAEKYIN